MVMVFTVKGKFNKLLNSDIWRVKMDKEDFHKLTKKLRHSSSDANFMIKIVDKTEGKILLASPERLIFETIIEE